MSMNKIVWHTKGFPDEGKRVILAYDLGYGVLGANVDIVTFADVDGMGLLPVREDGEELEFDEDTNYAWAYLPKLPRLGRWGDNPMWEEMNEHE